MVLKRILIIVILGSLVVGSFLGARKVLDLAANRNSTFGEEALVQRDFVPLEQWGERDVSKRESSNEDIVVNSQTRIFQDTELSQSGNIIVEGTGKLIFKSSILKMTPGQDELYANIFVRDKGEIVFESSTLKPDSDEPRNLYVNLSGEGRFVFKNSSGLHMLIARENAVVEMSDSIWALSLPNFRGGGVQVGDEARVHITNSTIGGLVLEFSQDAQVDIQNFRAGNFEDFDLVRDFSSRGVGFNVILEDSQILRDYHEGESERGLAIFAPANIRGLTVSNSTLNKLVITTSGEQLVFNGLDLGVARDFSYQNINMRASKVMAQWGFFLHGGSGHFTGSNGLWFSLYNNAELTLVDSEMNEFDTRDFTGIIDFDNVIWKDAGEIIMNSDFTWRGGWIAQGFAPKDFRPLVWAESRVTREFPVDVLSLEPDLAFVNEAKVELSDGSGNMLSESYTNKDGRAYFSVVFDDTNYTNKFYIKVTKGDKEIRHNVNFLTPTPIKLILK